MDEKSKWEYRTLEQTPGEQRLLIGAALEIAIEASFKLHLYSFKGRIYRQRRGGPIGSRLTMCVARVVMNSWGKLFRQRMEEIGITIYMETCYVDDLRYVLSLLNINIEWDSENNRWTDKRVKCEEEPEKMKRTVTWLKDQRRWDSVTNNKAILSAYGSESIKAIHSAYGSETFDKETNDTGQDKTKHAMNWTNEQGIGTTNDTYNEAIHSAYGTETVKAKRLAYGTESCDKDMLDLVESDASDTDSESDDKDEDEPIDIVTNSASEELNSEVLTPKVRQIGEVMVVELIPNEVFSLTMS